MAKKLAEADKVRYEEELAALSAGGELKKKERRRPELSVELLQEREG